MSTQQETAVDIVPQGEGGKVEPKAPVLPTPLLLDLSSLDLTDVQLEKLSVDNEPLQFELTAKGELVIMPPNGSKGGWQEGELFFQVRVWAGQDGTGVTFGSSTGFRLPNRAVRAPDVSWVRRERWETWLADNPDGREDDENRQVFANFCPDLVLELRSPSETLAYQRRKMEEYMENGCRLGWLIDPIQRRVHIYRPGTETEVLDNPDTVSGETVLAGFELDLREIW